MTGSAPEIRLPEGVKLPDGTLWEGRHVELDRFAGPLDLLLFLIREKKIPITEIKVAEITDQFLAYVKTLEKASRVDDALLDETGEFLVMAAILIQIKTRELLPQEETGETEELELSRDDLIRLLQEYEKYKAAAAELDAKRKAREKIFLRSQPLLEPTQEEELKADLTKLMAAFRSVLRRTPPEQAYELARALVKIEDCMDRIRERLRNQPVIAFEELFQPGFSRLHVIAYFLAFLELMKFGEITVTQDPGLGTIRLRRREAPALTVVKPEPASESGPALATAG